MLADRTLGPRTHLHTKILKSKMIKRRELFTDSKDLSWVTGIASFPYLLGVALHIVNHVLLLQISLTYVSWDIIVQPARFRCGVRLLAECAPSVL